MRKVLVIGGNGFLGKNIVERLLSDKYYVGVYDINKSEYDNVNSYVGDVINDNEFVDIIKEYDCLIYLITAIMPKQSMEDPVLSYQTDIPLIIKTLESCKKIGIKRIIYSSSGGTIYGENEDANKETQLCEPMNHYAICKLASENILQMYNRLYGMENVILRVSNPFGKYQRVESGVGVINTFIKRILNNKKIDVYGDGNYIRDFINVKYVAEAFCKACEWRFDKNYSPIFNVGSGSGISIKQIIDIISEETGKIPQVNYLAEREFDVKCNYLCTKKSEEILGVSICGNQENEIRKYVKNVMEKNNKENKINI